VGSGRRDWSDSVYRLHGYEPGAATLTTSLVLGHKHPGDLHGYVDALHAGMVHDRLIVHEHRLVAADGRVQPVLLVARPVQDTLGTTRTLHGFYLSTACDHEGGHARPSSSARLLAGEFGLTAPAAELLVRCRRSRTLRRSPEEQASPAARRPTGPSTDLRRVIEESMFPAEHFLPNPPALAA